MSFKDSFYFLYLGYRYGCRGDLESEICNGLCAGSMRPLVRLDQVSTTWEEGIQFRKFGV